MTWGKLGSTTLGSAGDDLDITSMTANTFNQFLIHRIASGISVVNVTLNDTGSSQYAKRSSINGATDVTSTSDSFVRIDSDSATDMFSILNVIGISTEEKLNITQTVTSGTTGAGTAPDRWEIVFKWINTSDSITRIDTNNTSAGSYNTDSNLSALGSEGQTAVTAKIQDGLIFEETDTNKHYIYDSSTDTWTEL